jgi:trehalose 6-phosphate synthase/phosphatase
MRLLIIANRLPVEITQNNGKFEYKPSPGGLVSGLQDSSSKIKAVWIGWPGKEIPKKLQPKLKKQLYSKYQSVPVFLNSDQIQNYYLGFSNKTVWPLFHYFSEKSSFTKQYWNDYREVNKIFAKEVLKNYKPGDLIFVQDYQLMLLPQMLRDSNPDLTIGFFLHIPFPSYELLRILPGDVRAEIIKGILGSDIIGFHTNEYMQHFLESVTKTTGLKPVSNILYTDSRPVTIENMPLGINFEKYELALKDKSILKRADELKKRFKGQKILFSVDRLDYTKGISERLLGFEKFLEINPEYHKKIVLILNTQPSRVEIDDYQELKNEVDRLVGRINSRFGTVEWTPIIYQFNSLPLDEMVVRYLITDIALITPLRDGMNLVSKEFIAVKGKAHKGVLILTETAGSARELTQAVMINPNDPDKIANAIKEALNLKPAEQKKRIIQMHTIVSHFTAKRWTDEWIEKLVSIYKSALKKPMTDILEKSNFEKILSDYKSAEKRLIILDYDGTLVPYAPVYDQARPSESLINLLKKLAKDPKNEVVILSGRDKDSLSRWINLPEVALVAEHGIWVKPANEYYFQAAKDFPNNWMSNIKKIMGKFTERIPKSLIEIKHFSLAFHYRQSNPEFVSQQLPDLLNELELATQNTDLEILHGAKIIEIKNKLINKGSSARFWISRQKYDFYLAAGDDLTDEYLFQALPEKAYSIKLGPGESNAKYRIGSVENTLKLLNILADTREIGKI